MDANSRGSALFQGFSIRHLKLANRIVMAPMTRSKSPGGVPGVDVAAYYRRRAEGGVGLIITEGTYIPHPGAGFDPNVPRFHGEDSLNGWRKVAQEVHRAGGKIFPQLWHVGLVASPGLIRNAHAVGPSGFAKPGELVAEPMTRSDIEQVIAAYGEAARSAQSLGFDGVEIHGAHGYLIDQFFWDGTNHRTDEYGGDLAARTRFAVEAIGEIRRRVGPEFPVSLRFSQWKLQDHNAKLAGTPAELASFLEPLANAGVDIFHCSQRRFWEPEFPGSTLNLAGWTKKLTGKPAITVGSVSLDQDFLHSFGTGLAAQAAGFDELQERLEREEFDLVAVGRALIANPEWPMQVKLGSLRELRPFQKDILAELV